MTLNIKLFYILNNLTHKSAVFDYIITFFADQFDKIVLGFTVLFFIVLFVAHKDWKDKGWSNWIREGFIIGVSVIGAWFVSFIIKSLTHIPRPFVAYSDIVPLFIHGGYDSFPSGHATVFFGLATAVYLYHKKLGILFFVCAGLITLARVIGGVHYPIDIIVGAIIGSVISKAIHHIFSRIFQKYQIISK